MKSTDELKQIVTQVRRDIVRMVHGAKSGHPGGSLGCADMVTTLYFSQMRINEAKGEDGFLEFSHQRAILEDQTSGWLGFLLHPPYSPWKTKLLKWIQFFTT